MIKPGIYHKENVLLLAFSGHVQPLHFELLGQMLPAIFRCFRPDFTLLTDFSKVEEMDFVCCRHIGELMDRVVAAGVGRVVRVAPDPRKDIGLNILAAFHYPHCLGVRICGDLSEAMKELGIETGIAGNDITKREPIAVH